MTVEYAWVKPPYTASVTDQQHYEWPGGSYTSVTIECYPMTLVELETEGWLTLSAEAFADEWDNPLDAQYDDL